MLPPSASKSGYKSRMTNRCMLTPVRKFNLDSFESKSPIQSPEVKAYPESPLKLKKYDFSNGSPVRNMQRQPSNESLEPLQRAPTKANVGFV